MTMRVRSICMRSDDRLRIVPDSAALERLRAWEAEADGPLALRARIVLARASGASLRETALRLRRTLVALLAFDLVLRLLPFWFNLAFGLPAAIIGWLCRAACLAFVVLDLRAAKEG